MADKAEIDSRWADLSRRLSEDKKLANAVESLDKALKVSVGNETKRRLRVPYASASSLDKGDNWD